MDKKKKRKKPIFQFLPLNYLTVALKTIGNFSNDDGDGNDNGKWV